MTGDVSVVVPTLGRPSLTALVTRLADGAPGRIAHLVVVDDRRRRDGRSSPLPLPGIDVPTTVLLGAGRGPAAARNLGWRETATRWVAFLDDDVLPDPDWPEQLLADLADLPEAVAGSAGDVRVPLPADRRPTDWERHTAGLQDASWITADLTYRRSVLVEVGGFDERFPRAYREDSDLALRVLDRGHRLVRGTRRVQHPVRPAGWWVSVSVQAGNADDVLMGRLHGSGWRRRASARRGRLPVHAALVGAGVLAAAAAAAGRRRTAVAAGALWLLGTTELATARIRPGPRTPAEVIRMLTTSALLPAAAVAHTFRGLATHRRPRPWRGRPDAVLFDRDGTLIEDVPDLVDPVGVVPMPGSRASLGRLRAGGIRVGVVTNQAAIGRGAVSPSQSSAVRARVSELLGPFDTWQQCPHVPADGCSCRKPLPGLVLAACHELAVSPNRCVVVGDVGSDVSAALRAGASAILVPTARTRTAEVRQAPMVANDLTAATDLIVGGAW